ncbi:MAG: TIGR03643 family protein [Verrucomicrobia bacterium]|nr:TIGR03643 family protein [Roseibacillus sp.]RCL36947.1 MAG: TIGR03643 family protein [Verrucomicrobiota bacterium]RPF90140.1 MAG: TIGR03643 family protein [Roseibacillus sp. TMED18]
MAKHGNWPATRKAFPEPSRGSTDWVIWAAWADRITFEEIYQVSGLREPAVIKLMRRHLKPGSFRRWRKRANSRSIKHRKRFQRNRELSSRLFASCDALQDLEPTRKARRNRTPL